ncbi:GNAT family N-acetyltransferase [Taibaiella soli]|uniref:GNAT family N-acetyltransferase n=1 Tax=Taibaiella soli TaxID=1649169 RepID=A0A2W2ANY7_9BACT|nr:GNAT family N-acetyltransferase [Taibaiella soli]PZF74080.1 GNAT family N-acetyltransferase [Taibaiella soli]
MIRPATRADADFVVPLIVKALVPGAFQLTGSGSEQEAYPVVKKFFLQEINRHSYRNALVYQDAKQGVIGSVVFYNGDEEEAMAQPINDFLNAYYEDEEEQYLFEAESASGEFYIDTISVRDDFRGKGIGQQLIEAACAAAKSRGATKMGLIVDDENPLAKKLYERIGFVTVGQKQLWEHSYDHMQRNL